MRSGLLRNRLRIEEAVDVISATGDGQPVKSWNVLATVWGSVEPLSGRELFTAQQVSARTTHKIIIRARTVSPKNRIVFGLRIFHITSVANKSERDIAVEIMAEEVTK